MNEQGEIFDQLEELAGLRIENERFKKAAQAILDQIPPIDRWENLEESMHEFERLLGLTPVDEYGHPIDKPWHEFADQCVREIEERHE